MAKTYEYKLCRCLEKDIIKTLHELGREGWKVSVLLDKSGYFTFLLVLETEHPITGPR